MTNLFEYNFMRLAFAAILIITPLLGILGTMVVQKKMAFFSDALGHSALTGIALGLLLGITGPSLAMLLYGLVFALLLNAIQRHSLSSTDTVISVFASGSTAIGLAILSKGGNFSSYSALLIGDILSITRSEVFSLLGISIHPTMARSANISVRLMENVFSLLIAAVVMLSIRWVGILLISALLIIPAASSRNISCNMREYHVYSLIFSMFSGVIGLVTSYYSNVATGPMIVIVASIIYFATYFYGRRVK